MEAQQLKEEIVEANKEEVLEVNNKAKPNLRVLIPALIIIPIIGTGVMSFASQGIALIVDTILFGGAFLYSLKKKLY